MLQIQNGAQIAVDDYYIQHKENGLDELHFEIQLSDPAYRALTEEARIIETTEHQIYTVKTISGGKKTAKIGCRLDLSDWEQTLCIDYNRSGTPLMILKGAVVDFLGDSSALSVWTIVDSSGNTERRTIQMQGPTPLELAVQIQESFGCAVRFDTSEKTAAIIYPDDIPLSNSYAVDTVNLRAAPEYKGKSSNLYTRLYPVGRDGLRIGSVNGGLDYVQNLSYTNQVICAFWQDSRYTNADELRDDAQKRVDEAAQPERSWKLPIVDLYRLNPQKWKDMGLSIFTVLRLIDSNKGFSANVQVREDKVYPYYPEKNEITVSTVTRSVQRTLRSVYNDINNPNSAFWQKIIARG